MHQTKEMFWKRKAKEKAIEQHAPYFGNGQESININASVLTDIGNIRSNNEDAALIVRNGEGDNVEILLMVADGMGGHQAGEVASQLAVETISKDFFKNKQHSNIEKALLKAFTIANNLIYQKATKNKSLYGMGTTCTALVVVNTTVFYAHVGDSRAYFFHDGILSRITEDHTYVQQLLNIGEISILEAAAHPNRNILTNAMGTNPQVKIDIGKCALSLQDADRLVICSDGLHDYFDDLEITDFLRSEKPLQEIAEIMVTEAKRRGGHDNITIVLAERASIPNETKLKNTGDIEIHIT